MGDQKQITPSREPRGKGFPKISLGSALDIIEKASKYGRQWTREQFASYGSKAGKGSAKSGAFINRLAALRDFGLINISGAMISRTELGDQITKPLKPEEREQAVYQAFLNADVFKSIVETVEKNINLAKNDIAEIAVKQLGVSRNAKDRFVSSFVESGKVTGIITEVDKSIIQVVSFSPPDKGDGAGDNLEPAAVQPNLDPGLRPVVGQASTTFSSHRAGETWDLLVQVRSSVDIDPDILDKVIKLIRDAEQIAKLFKQQGENESSDNKS